MLGGRTLTYTRRPEAVSYRVVLGLEAGLRDTHLSGGPGEVQHTLPAGRIFVAFVMWEEQPTGVRVALLSSTVVWLGGASRAKGFVTQDYCRQVIARGLSGRLGSEDRV